MATTQQAVLLSWVLRLAMILAFCAVLASPWLTLHDHNTWLAIFFTIFVLRYTRLVGHMVGYWLYRPSLISPEPSFNRKDVTVLLPTIDPNGPDFQECIRSILSNQVASIIIITVGAALKADCKSVLEALAPISQGTSLSVCAIRKPSKRRQIAHSMPHVSTSVTILTDDHVFWGPNFVPAVLAPLENPNVGMVATKKRVRRTTPGKWTWLSVVNFIACNYLERHNWELRASNAIDGSLFVISGRTAVYRTEFLADPTLLDDFCHEKFFFGLFGKQDGLGPDDDNHLSRNAMKKGWLIRFQDTEDAIVETTLGEWPKFNGQILRWARTTFRSNPVMLRNPDFCFRYTWGAFMVYWAGLMNFALFWDFALVFTLVRAWAHDQCFPAAWVVLLVFWIVATKTIKILPQLHRYPQDLPLLVCQVGFAYVHSLYKLWALITFWDCDWSGRNLDDVDGARDDHDVESLELVA